MSFGFRALGCRAFGSRAFGSRAFGFRVQGLRVSGTGLKARVYGASEELLLCATLSRYDRPS